MISLFFIICFTFTLASRFELETSELRLTHGWQSTGSAKPEQTMHLSFALKLQNMDFLQQKFDAVSDPQNAQYGQHMSQEQIDQIVKPSEKTVKVMQQFIKNHFGNVIIDSSIVGFLNINATVAQVEKAFACQVESFVHKKAPKMVLAKTHKYTIPMELKEHLDFVGGLVRLPHVEPRVSSAVEQNAAERLLAVQKRNVEQNLPWPGVTPRMIRKRYNVSSVAPKAAKSRQAIAQFIGQFYSDIDLNEFFVLMYQELIGSTPSKTEGPNGLIPGVESNLDVQYIMSVSAGVDTWVFSTKQLHNGQEPFLRWIQTVAKVPQAEVPKVISVSYGDVEASLSRSYAIRLNAEFMKMGLRGISIIFAAGDSGAACQTNGHTFQPDWPASCPAVTTVGGTATEKVFEEGPEVVNYIGGSGFSNYFVQPSYQKAAVASYVKEATKAGSIPPQSFFNATGRAYPDVSAFSSAFWVVYSLLPTPVSGTSCAAPTFAAIISLVNDHRLQAGKPPLGFLNPFLYQQGASNPEAFHDVVDGCNAGCYKDRGFCATKGFDLASGWGSPNYKGLI